MGSAEVDLRVKTRPGGVEVTPLSPHHQSGILAILAKTSGVRCASQFEGLVQKHVSSISDERVFGFEVEVGWRSSSEGRL